MRYIFLLILLLALDFYAFQAVKTISENWSASAKNWTNISFWLTGFFAVVPIILLTIYIGKTIGVVPEDVSGFQEIRAILIMLYAGKLMMVGILFIDDLRRLMMTAADSLASRPSFDYGRSKFLSTVAVVLGSLPFLTLTYGMIRNRYRYKVFNKKISLDNLPNNLKGLRIVQISDIHSGSFTMKESVKPAIDLINAQKPDLVFFTGDLVNSIADEMDNFTDVFDKIEAKYGVYSIFGNHDYGDYVRWPSREAKIQNLEKLKGIHKKMGWDLLLNENRILEINGEKVAVIGVENYSTSKHFPKYGDLKKAYQGAENSALKLLLSHDPTHWESKVLESFKDIAITFSGHTHGMQFGFEIPGFIKWSPAKYIYKQWAGLYKKDNQFLYVNRGFGFLGYPGRVGILPEITVIELESKNSLT